MAPAAPADRLPVLATACFPGRAAEVSNARDFTRAVLGADWPCLDEILGMVSEIASNAIRHTASADDGGWFDLTVSVTEATVRVAIADRGGCVGVIFCPRYLGADGLEPVVKHLKHILDVVGEDCPALGSDWDGAIVTPRDMATCLELPHLCELMLRRRFSPARIQKILGGNFLRALGTLRG